MAAVHIHQIFYDEHSRKLLDPGFIPLDNASNLRPDWREYWPIRNFLQSTALNPDDYYGFFSPKFKTKTGLEASEVNDFVQRNAAKSDVFLFSPYVDLSALWANVFTHFNQHKNDQDTLRSVIGLISPGFENFVSQLVMDSRNTVYCNYFVAKPEFWSLWMHMCERIFVVAEAADTDLGRRLNAGADYDAGSEPLKVFIVERIASWLLATYRYTVKAYDPWAMPPSTSRARKYRKELIQMDALKIAFNAYGSATFFDQYRDLQNRITLQEKENPSV